MKAVATSIALMLLTLGCGGHKPPTALVVKALASTHVVFQTGRQEPITLSARGAERLMQAVKLLEDPLRVEVRKEILPAYSGRFVLGDVSLGWVGSLLCLKDPSAQKYYVVQDSVLARMSELYFKKVGQPPTHELSREEWQEVLAALENAK